MAHVVTAGPETLSQILQQTYPIWNEGLTLDGYTRWNTVQARTPWGAAHLTRVALMDGDVMLASAKRYDIAARLDGKDIRLLGIGAVFTPEAQRGKGHAPELIRQMCADAERDGFQVAVLFSEIGAPYYERLGFTAVPRETLTLEVIQKKGAPASLVRAGNETDLKRLAELHDIGDAFARFSPRRSEDVVQFAVQKRRTLSALAPLGARTTEFWVSEEGNHAVAYVLISRGPTGNLADGPEVMWLDACGDRDPTGARVGAILQVLYARTPAEILPPLRAWLPDGWLPPQVKIASREAADDILMVKALGGTTVLPMHGREITWWRADYF